MSNSFFESIKAGLENAIDYERNKATVARSASVSVAPLPRYANAEIKMIRENLGFTQKTFAGLQCD